MAEGDSNLGIAKQLQIDKTTDREQVQSILQHLYLKSRVAAEAELRPGILRELSDKKVCFMEQKSFIWRVEL